MTGHSDQGVTGSEQLIELWQLFRQDIARLLVGIGCPADTVDDVLQDVYVAAMQSAKRPHDASGVRKWLLRIAVNRFRVGIRQKTRRSRALEWLARVRPQQHIAVAVEAQLHQEQQLVRATLQQLDYQTRAILVLRYFIDLNSSEIGAVLGINDSTVRTRLADGRLALAKGLKRAGYQHE